MRRLFAALTFVLLLPACAHETNPAYIGEINQWHAERIKRLTADDGWLTLVGLHPLQGGVNTLGSAAGMAVQLNEKSPDQVGAVTVGEDQILFTTHPGVDVREAGSTTTQPIVSITLQTDRSGVPTVLAVGSLSFFVIDRDGLLFLRVKDSQSEVRTNFTGIDRFPVDDRWRITAHLEAGPATIAVPNVLGQTSEVASPGVLVFKVKGKECRLTPQGEPGKGLFIVFGDATNGGATYTGGRFLSTDPPQEDGTVILDFNKSTNPPCVFTPFATCPLPSLDNQLAAAIESGEKMWGEAH